jgi:hypothetical protein
MYCTVQYCNWLRTVAGKASFLEPALPGPGHIENVALFVSSGIEQKKVKKLGQTR